MESEEITTGRVHHGRNIRRVRIDKNINQDVLSELVQMAQSKVSKYENTRVIGDEMLHRFAKALEVPFEYLENLEENAPMMIFESNTVNNNEKSNANNSFVGDQQNSYHPIEAITELVDKNTELYERLLKEKDGRIATLEKRLENLENGLNK